MRTALVLIAALFAVALSGCKGSCRQLSERLCECEANTPLREQCVQRVATEEGRVRVDAQSEARCAALLKVPQDQGGCDCRRLETYEGKVACGLAWPTDAGTN